MMELGPIDIGIYLVGNLIRLYIISWLFKIFFIKEAEPKTLILRKLFYALYYIVNGAGFAYFHVSPNINILINVAGLFLVVMTYKGKLLHKLLAVLAGIVLPTICEDLAVVAIIILGIEDFFVIGIIAADVLLFMITILISKFLDIKHGIKLSFAEWVIIVVVPALTLFISIVVLGKRDNMLAVAVGEVSLILINILIFIMLNKLQTMYKNEMVLSIVEQQNAAYEEQMNMFQESESRVRAIRHDMKNHFIAIEELAKEEGNEKIQKYMCDLNAELESTKSIVSTGNFFVDSFLNYKLNLVKKNNTEIETDIVISDTLFVLPKDLSIIIGNLIDNAIDAVNDCKENKKIGITMKQNPGNLYICIENTFDNKIKKKGDRFISTKGDLNHHGYGIENVKSIVEKYEGNISFDTSDNNFTVKLMLFDK